MKQMKSNLYNFQMTYLDVLSLISICELAHSNIQDRRDKLSTENIPALPIYYDMKIKEIDEYIQCLDKALETFINP